ncbi:class II fructose-bisphosphatase [Salinibacterium sp. dk2585]|uniref:class II fructose-bisphosphatase n=1 Tax=unclassified Salinibacterium TaxID=2632331 RepID=UPI0011C24A2A|nr:MULTISPECIES: class II fructose-bisphosphatase [unclassified Salinibacterium]QEE62674.1 class II fructose-bisphosphatase [Salinibacterium sp. dk2585]TXK54839.1 class II fructose-bisphosphatase [Salinibacterium sp. dk5596]
MIAHPDRNLAMELVRATEAAAIRAYPWIGRGDKLGADGAAVDAMRKFLGTVDFEGTVVIGEGEKDEAPMLFNGEVVGNGNGPACDIAVDPIDGTSLTAAGRQNAISMIAVSDRGTMLDASSVFYMEKIVTGAAGIGVVDIRKPMGENVRALAKALGKDVGSLRVAVLDRPRHAELIDEIRAAGAGTRLMLDGDVAGGINAARYESRIDMCVGIGGSPEGVATAAAIKALGGFIQGRLAPTTDEERQRGIDAGLKFDYVYEADELVRGDNTFFVATGVTNGELVSGVQRKGPIIRTESVVLRARSGTIRRVVADHLVSKWLDD